MYTLMHATSNAWGYSLLVLQYFFFTLAIIAVALRLWSRKIIKKNLQQNDYTAIIALFFSATLIICLTTGVAIGGIGQDQEHVSRESVMVLFQVILASELTWTAANTAIKLSLLHFYNTIFSVPTFRRVSHGVGILVLVLAVANVIQCLAICQPIEYQWNRNIPGGRCGDQTLGILLVAIFNLATDLIIVGMPMPMLWNLQMRKETKIGLTAVFGLGVIICIITSLRILFTVILIRNHHNATYWVAPNAICLILEPLLGIINACVPLLRPILAKVNIKVGLTSHSKSRDNTLELPPRSNLGKQHFQRLNDSHLDSKSATINHITADRHNEDHVLHSRPTQPQDIDEGLNNSITVTESWDVTHYKQNSA